MKTAMYIFLNRELNMSVGKAAAQASHAACLAVAQAPVDYSDDPGGGVWRNWWSTGYTKLVMEARDASHMTTLERYFTEHDYKSFLVIDEGRTEVASHSITALATEVVDKDDPRAWIFQEFKLYKPPKAPERGRKLFRG